MAAVMIGVDPHKGSHTAAVIGAAGEPLADVRVRAPATQAEQLLAWAAAWPDRTWAIEGAAGLGNLLAQQLVSAGERVVDVQPELAARVRLLASGNTNKNDPNDARSVAVAALRSPARRPVTAEDHTTVLKVWSKRYRDLGRARTQVACRLHAVLADLIPGGFSREITAGQAAGLLQRIEPSDAIAQARCELAAEFLADLRRLDTQMRDTRNRLAAAVRASGSTLTGIFGVGPVTAAAILGTAGQVARFGDRDRFAAYNGTAPIEVSAGERKICRLSLRGNRRPATLSTWPRPPRSGTSTAPAAPTSTARSPRARPARRPSAASNGGSATPSTPASKRTPALPRPPPPAGAREGNRGTALTPARPARTPGAGSSGKPLPGPPSHYGPGQSRRERRSARNHPGRPASRPGA